MYISDKIIHAGDTNTQIRFPAADTITAETAGTERLRISSSGKVNIGDNQTSQNILNIEDGTAASMEFASHGTGGDTAYIGVKKSTGGGLTFGISNRDIIFKTGASYSGGTAFDGGSERLRINSSGKVIIGNNGTTFGNAAVQAFIQHGNTAGESGFSSVDTTSVAAGVGGEIAFHGKYNTGAQDYAYFGHIRGTKENATAGDTACALKFFTRPNATAPIERLRIDSNGHVLPTTNNAYDLGSSSLRWRNVYTTALQLSNKGKTNDVDNTWGDYTIQEGESDLFLINNRNGKKYKFNLTEVS